MPQPCKICTHTDRQAIDAALIANRDSLRRLASKFDVGKSSLARHFHSHLEPGQDALLRQIGEPGQVSEPQSTTPHYDAFIERFHGGRTFSMTEIRSWDYSQDVLEAFIDVAIERGDLTRRSEP